MEIIKAEHITKQYTGHKALDDVSVSVRRGSIHGLLGPNGAGKTTLIRIINRITLPDDGIVYFDGHPLEAADTARMGYLPEERGLYKKMKVGEQAMFFARLKGMEPREARKRLNEWFERLEMTGWWDKKIEELSKGMAQKVQFVVTVMHQPPLLILDEPFSGFDPINANMLKREILRLRDEGTTIILSSHDMTGVEQLCDSISLIYRSHCILGGEVGKLRRQFSDNSLTLSYEGSAEQLQQAAAPFVSQFELTDTDRDGYSTARLQLQNPDAARQLIAAVNNCVNIKALTERLPSVGEIFVKAVEGCNVPTA